MSGITLDLLLLQIVTGIALGAVYVLFALGLSLIFGMLTVVNFAHGAFFMVGAYFGVWLFAQTGNFWVCLVLVPLGVGNRHARFFLAGQGHELSVKIIEQPRGVGIVGQGFLGLFILIDGRVLRHHLAQFVGGLHNLLRVHGHDVPLIVDRLGS